MNILTFFESFIKLLWNKNQTYVYFFKREGYRHKRSDIYANRIGLASWLNYFEFIS